MPDETLLMLASGVRGKTLRLLDPVLAAGDEVAARFAPAGLNNSVLWHAGHALVVVEHLSVMPATGRPAAYPPGWFDTFSWKSNPATVTNWPTLGEVVAALKEQLPRLTAAIAAASPQQLDQIVDPQKNRTLRYSILHGLHDEAGHQGEIWLLRKTHARRSAAATSTGS
jgi:hypothetical protein